MTIHNDIIKNKLKLINNDHAENTNMLLDKLLKDANITQAQFAKKIGKDASTVNRWIKNSRAIAWDNAEKIAKILGCHPVDIYKPHHSIKIEQICQWDGPVQDVEEKNQIEVNIPYEYYHDNLTAILMEHPGTPSDGEVWLFDKPKIKNFSKYAVGRICLLTASKNLEDRLQKKLGKKVPCCNPLIAQLKAQGDGKLKIVNSYTGELINEHCKDLEIKDLAIATPVKAKYDPDLVDWVIK
nr:putative lexA-like repressor [uncultured Mediterranean phage uvMED]